MLAGAPFRSAARDKIDRIVLVLYKFNQLMENIETRVNKSSTKLLFRYIIYIYFFFLVYKEFLINIYMKEYSECSLCNIYIFL